MQANYKFQDCLLRCIDFLYTLATKQVAESMMLTLAKKETWLLNAFQDMMQKEVPLHITVAMLSMVKGMCFDPGCQSFVVSMCSEVMVSMLSSNLFWIYPNLFEAPSNALHKSKPFVFPVHLSPNGLSFSPDATVIFS